MSHISKGLRDVKDSNRVQIDPKILPLRADATIAMNKRDGKCWINVFFATHTNAPDNSSELTIKNKIKGTGKTI